MTTKQAIKFFGSRRKLAEALGISPISVYKPAWDGEPPMLRQYQIERLSKGALKARKGQYL